jgi:hypothetical protein
MTLVPCPFKLACSGRHRDGVCLYCSYKWPASIRTCSLIDGCKVRWSACSVSEQLIKESKICQGIRRKLNKNK